jgi:hypothetical protein
MSGRRCEDSEENNAIPAKAQPGFPFPPYKGAAMRHLPSWMFAAFGEPISFQDTAEARRVPAKIQKPNPLSLRWLAEHLEALASDQTIPLPTAVRVKSLTRIDAMRRIINEDPISAAWALRQIFNFIRHTVR